MAGKKGLHNFVRAAYTFRPKVESVKIHECDKLVDLARIVHGIATLPSGKEVRAVKTHNPLPVFTYEDGTKIPMVIQFIPLRYENSDREVGKPFGDDAVEKGDDHDRGSEE